MDLTPGTSCSTRVKRCARIDGKTVRDPVEEREMRKLILTVIVFLAGMQVQAAQPPSIRFLSTSAARDALSEGSGRDYYAQLQLADIRSKTGLALEGASLAAAREQARAAYAEATLEFTPDERAALREAIEGLQPLLVERAPIYARTPWSFIKLGSAIEGGRPHTRGNTIVLSEVVMAWVLKMKAQAPLTKPSLIWNLLIHEQTHVIQRQHPELFSALYSSVFGFQHATLEATPTWISSLRVINPDAPDVEWIFSSDQGAATQWLLPDLLINDRAHPQMPMGFQIVALGVKNQGDRWAYLNPSSGNPQLLYGIDAYIQRFPIHDELFHPNEIAANMLAAWITGVRMKDPDNPMWNKMSDWAAAALK